MIDAVQEHLNLWNFKNYHLKTLVVNSQILKKNPLKDTPIRRCPVLVPNNKKNYNKWVLVLSGFTGNGGKNFNVRFHEMIFPNAIDQWTSQKKIPQALYIFVDAMTYWGGSQFINSHGCGRYEDYIMKELLPHIQSHWAPESTPKICVMGGSSGGYGALHLSTQYPQIFHQCIAIAPDSFFDMSLLPEIYQALPYIEQWGDIRGIKKRIEEEKFFGHSKSFTVLNALGMSLCYSPKSNCYKKFDSPIDLKSGQVIPSIWKEWKKKDPIYFLDKRKISKNTSFYIDVGNKDQFHLQYGCRQIRDILQRKKAHIAYNEFDGHHFDISQRRFPALQWLKKVWSE